jgi:hypothetical protein
MSEIPISYIARPDATPEAERSALAAIYRIVLSKKEAAPECRPDDEKGTSSNDSLAKTRIP